MDVSRCSEAKNRFLNPEQRIRPLYGVGPRLIRRIRGKSSNISRCIKCCLGAWRGLTYLLLCSLVNHSSSFEVTMSQHTADSEKKPLEGAGQANHKPEIDEYPSTQKRVVIMMALYLAVFLVTLVCDIIILESHRFYQGSDRLLTFSSIAGPKHHIDSYSQYNQRVPLFRRHWVVWLGLFTDNVRPLTCHGQGLQILPCQASLPSGLSPIRSWLGHLWFGSQLYCLHFRPCYCRNGIVGAIFGGDGYHVPHRPVTAAADLPRRFRSHLRNCISYWPPYRR